MAALGSRKAISTIPCVASSNFDAPGRALVSHRRSRLLLARWHNRVPRSSRQAGQSRRISHRAGRNRKRAQPAGGVKQATVLAIGEKEKRWRHTLFLRARLLRYRSSEPGTAAGVAHACGNVALLRHLARDLRRTGSRFPSASPAKTEAGSHRWRRSSPLMNSLAIQPRWQAVVELWLAFLVTQRRLKPAAEGYQVCAGEEHEDEHPHFSGHDLTLSQILRGARNELSLLNDAQWSPESPAFEPSGQRPVYSGTGDNLPTACTALTAPGTPA